MNDQKTQRTGLEILEPGVAPITHQAPQVNSGKERRPFAPLYQLAEGGKYDFELRRGKRSAKLVWRGLKVRPRELVTLLKSLPRKDKIHGVIKRGEKTISFCFDGKLRKCTLSPPDEDGLLLYWKRAPEEVSELVPAVKVKTLETFEPCGEKLGRFALKYGETRPRATLYRSFEANDPGVFLFTGDRLVRRLCWADFQVEAPYCQLVVKGGADWTGGISKKLAAQFRKLAKLAAARSAEMNPSPVVSGPSDLDPAKLVDLPERLKDSPRFQAAYQSLKDDKPPLVTTLQILELLCHGAGQVSMATVTDRIGLPDHRLWSILAQMDTMLRGSDEVLLSLSLDRKVLLLDRDRLSKLFALELSSEEMKVVRAETVEGEKCAVRLPMEVTVKERRALEALLRYGRLSEQELSQITGSRRVGGMLERLLSRLESEGYYGLGVVGESAEGRIFALQF
jgi:hypothetical protein